MMSVTVNFIQRRTDLAIISCEPVVEDGFIIGLRFQLVKYEGIEGYSDSPLRYVVISLNRNRLHIGFEDEDGYLSPPRHSIDAMKLEYMRVCELVEKYGFECMSYQETE